MLISLKSEKLSLKRGRKSGISVTLDTLVDVWLKDLYRFVITDIIFLIFSMDPIIIYRRFHGRFMVGSPLTPHRLYV